jgi:hypothetical protein
MNNLMNTISQSSEDIINDYVKSLEDYEMEQERINRINHIHMLIDLHQYTFYKLFLTRPTTEEGEQYRQEEFMIRGEQQERIMEKSNRMIGTDVEYI